jgi:hypothetical protein
VVVWVADDPTFVPWQADQPEELELAVQKIDEGVLDEARLRTGAAWDALRGGPVDPPIGRRRWPVAAVAALAGAVGGVAVALLIRRVRTADAPDAVEPEQLEAVVDRAV